MESRFWDGGGQQEDARNKAQTSTLLSYKIKMNLNWSLVSKILQSSRRGKSTVQVTNSKAIAQCNGTLFFLLYQYIK